jgi:hypothetical protein
MVERLPAEAPVHYFSRQSLSLLFSHRQRISQTMMNYGLTTKTVCASYQMNESAILCRAALFFDCGRSCCGVCLME